MTELSPAQLAAEIHHFIRGYQQIRGLDPEFIYRIHAGSELEAALRISRLQQIAECLKRLQEPEGPTDEELLCIAAKSIEPYDQILPGEYEPESNSAVEVYGSELIIYARAVLARWGK